MLELRGDVAIAALVGAFVSAGCGDTTNRAGSGDTTPGNVYAGAMGIGGSGSTQPQTCYRAAAPNTHISDFTVWDGGNWGYPNDLNGGATLYQSDSPSAFQADVDVNAADPNLHLVANVLPTGYAGFVMWFAACVDASRFSGIQFELGGTLGGATLSFQVQMNDDYPVDARNKKGACLGGNWTEATCWNNRAEVTLDADAGDLTRFSYAWADLKDGHPISPIDPTQLIGLQWEATCSGSSDTICAVDLRLDTVEFFPP